MLSVLAATGLAGCGGGSGGSDDEETTQPTNSAGETTAPTDGGETDGQEEAPSATFSFTYNESERRLEVAHQAGENIPASRLFLRGEGIEGQQWSADSASGTKDGEPAVRTGDILTLTDVPSDYDISVVWEGEGQASTLATDEGPGT